MIYRDAGDDWACSCCGHTIARLWLMWHYPRSCWYCNEAAHSKAVVSSDWKDWPQITPQRTIAALAAIEAYEADKAEAGKDVAPQPGTVVPPSLPNHS